MFTTAKPSPSSHTDKEIQHTVGDEEKKLPTQNSKHYSGRPLLQLE
jgi:hypothetical protein